MPHGRSKSPWWRFGGSGGEKGKRGPTFKEYLNKIQIGQGAFADVYYARDPRNREVVALKKINLDVIEDPTTLQLTMREIDLFKRLEHPNIVRCYRSFEEADKLYGYGKKPRLRNNLILVLEYVDGGDLEQWMGFHAMPPNFCGMLQERLIWYIFVQIADSLQYIHSERIIHRDLKPANVLLTQRLQVKLTDFGLSKQNRNTGAKTVCGTPYYMAPERIAELGYSFMSDIWSLGCILYEMASLCSPFCGEKDNVTSLIEKVKTSDYPPVHTDCYSPQLLAVIDACLNPCAMDRPKASEVHHIAQMMSLRFNAPSLHTSPYSLKK